MTESSAFAPDPSHALAAMYEAVRQARMDGLPVVNNALEVEAVAFAPFEAYWLGIMLTPWFMNVVLAPRDREAWQPIAPGAKRVHRLPAGDFEFIGACDEAVGPFAIASLFSPVLEFEDQATARVVAAAARDALVTPVRHRESAAGPLRRLEQALDAPQSRADFLHGRLPQSAR